jgi:hypothetical protein
LSVLTFLNTSGKRSTMERDFWAHMEQ